MDKQLPFIIIRSFGSGKKNENFIKILFEMQRKHPGLINEIWFGGSSLEGLDEVERQALDSLPFREECRKLGIRFSFQIGQTLNHAADGRSRPHFTDEAWSVDCTGKLLRGLLCPLSPEAQEYTQKSAEVILRTLKPDSLWPDDDLRLHYKGDNAVCFCHRCVDRFNERFHHHLTREELKALLETNDSAEAAEIRKEWTISNAENLAEFASVYRMAVDKEAPDCMLGIQTVCANWIYDGPDLITLLKGLAGKEVKKVGIRPGALYYKDDEPRQMLPKVLDIQTEGARCRRSGIVSQICYEAENWPHIGAEKNPYSQMAECALALASGADSLALYWGTDIHRESDELNRFYFEAVHEYKPFFLAVSRAFEGTEPSGISLYRGSKIYEQPEWKTLQHPMERMLMENGLPVTRPETAPEAFWLDERAVKELSAADLPQCFAHTVLMNTSTFELLDKTFPELKFTKKVQVRDVDSQIDINHHSKNERFECFEGDKLCIHLEKTVFPQTADVRPYSSVTGVETACGTCMIPTEFGGSIVLKQNTKWPNFWNGYRRKAVLDALDDATGGLCVRLNTNGFSINILGRKTADGRTAGAFLLNLGCGRTMPLELAVRNPAFRQYALYLPGKEAVELTPVRQTEKELVFRLPGLEAWQPAMIAGIQ